MATNNKYQDNSKAKGAPSPTTEKVVEVVDAPQEQPKQEVQEELPAATPTPALETPEAPASVDAPVAAAEPEQAAEPQSNDEVVAATPDAAPPAPTVTPDQDPVTPPVPDAATPPAKAEQSAEGSHAALQAVLAGMGIPTAEGTPHDLNTDQSASLIATLCIKGLSKIEATHAVTLYAQGIIDPSLDVLVSA